MAPKRSYAWALAFNRGDEEVRALSGLAQEGLELAQSFARNARLRSAAALAGDLIPQQVTAADLAEGWTNPVHVHFAIKQARLELFGKPLSDSAIAYRLNQRRARKPRTCGEPGCEEPISALAHGSRRFCPWHGSVHARVARYRARRSA
jgi:hypothetical protein